MKESEVTQSCLALFDPLGSPLAGPPSMGFCRQEHWNALPFLAPNSAGRLQHTHWWSVYSLAHSNSAFSVFPWALWSCPEESQPRWWVCGRSLEGCQRLSPRTSPLLTPQLRSGALPGFTSITEPPHRPHQVFRAQVRRGSQDTQGDPTAAFRVLWPRHIPGSERFASESLGWFSSPQDP